MSAILWLIIFLIILGLVIEIYILMHPGAVKKRCKAIADKIDKVIDDSENQKQS